MPPLLPVSTDPLSLLRHPHSLRSILSSIQPSPHSTLLPTRTTPEHQILPRTLASLLIRQATVTANPIIPATYAGLNSGPTPGTVVGIVFGSVAGFLLVLWLIYTCFNAATFGGAAARTSVLEEEIVTSSRRRSRSARRSPSRRAPSPSSHTRSEIIEVQSSRRERSPPPRERTPPRSVRETVIIEETRRAPPPREEPPPDDIVEVIEEHSPVRRESSRRAKPSGYRTVDPEAFGGGGRPLRKVSRH